MAEILRRNNAAPSGCATVPTLNGRLLAKNSLINLVGYILPMLVAIATIPLIVKGLGTERFGVLTLAWMIVGYFSLFDMGLGRATTKFVAEYLGQDRRQDIGNLVWTSLGMLLVFGLLGTAVSLLVIPWLVTDILNIPPELLSESRQAFYLLAFAIPIVTLSVGASGILEAWQRFDQVNLVKIPVSTAAFLVPILLLPFTNNLVAIVGVMVALRLLGLAAYLWFSLRLVAGPGQFTGLQKSLLKRLLGYGGWLSISHIIWPFMNYLDRFIIGAMLTMSAVAYYVTPFELAGKLLIISGSILGVMFPAFSACSEAQPEKLTSLFNVTVKYLLLILTPAVFAILVMAWPFFRLWLGEEFAVNCALILQILALGKLINAVSQVPSSAIQAMGRPDITAKLHMLELPIYLGLLWFFVNSLGIVGAALAWSLRVIIDSSLYFIIYYRLAPKSSEKNPRINLRVVVWSALLMLAAIPLSGLEQPYLQAGALICILGLSGILCWRKFLDEDERNFIKDSLAGFGKDRQSGLGIILRIEKALQKRIRMVYFRNKRQILGHLKGYKQTQDLSLSRLEKLQLEKLNFLLNHAWRKVPYYADILGSSSFVKNGRIELESLEQFKELPLLTKELIRSQKDRLYSLDRADRKAYEYCSGGSTGQPVKVLQDPAYRNAAEGTLLLAKNWRGVGPFDSEVMIWGAQRDTFEGKKPLKSYFQDFLRNRIIINSYKMTPNDMRRYIGILNRHRPAMIRAYADAIFELAHFASLNNLRVEPQRLIHSAVSTLHDFMRREIEDVFKCPVFNHYGCREVGSIASECPSHDGLHILMMHNYVEVLDKHGSACHPGQEGEIVVTSLDNYSMPIIRYKIGDLGIMREYEICSCGCSYPRLAGVTGRTSEVFRTRDGQIVSPAYFAQLLGVFYKDTGISNFQIIQKDFDRVRIRLLKGPEINPAALDYIKDKVQIVMGTGCRVEYDFVDEIETTLTGKSRYAVSEVG